MEFSTLDALLELLGDSPFMPLLKDEVIDCLVICKAILIDPPTLFSKDGTVEELKSMVRHVGSIFSSFDLKKINEYMALELCIQIHQLIKDGKSFSHAKQIFQNSPKPSRLHYPRTSPHVFIDNLLENLEELVKDTASPTRPFNHLILRIQRHIDFWNSHLREISSDPPNGLKDIINNIINMAYEVEYVIDSFLVGDFPSWHCIFYLVDIFNEFEQIKWEGNDDEDGEEGLEAKKTMINDMLFGGGEQLNVISITGRPRIGKSTFVKELYNSLSVIDYFEARAWCDVFPCADNIVYLLVKLLEHFYDSSDITRQQNELSEQVYKCLKERRFLVVVDGLDDITPWVHLRKCFPNSQNGSRIVFTSTMKGLAFQAKYKSIVNPQYPLRDEIWEIRMKSLFQKENCRPELLELGMRIARRCKFHSVPWVKALLNTTEKTKNRWEEIAKTLGSRILGDAISQERRILELNYMFLPDHLKQCFLYVRVALLWGKVLRAKLIRLWIAEGFIKSNAFQSLENTGKEYFADLLARNLLIPSGEQSNERVKFYILHRLVHEFISNKVMEDNFLELINGYDALDDGESSSSTSLLYYQHRLHITTNIDQFILLKPSGPFVKTLVLISSYEDIKEYRYSSYDISFIFENFKYLRILNFEDTNVGDSFIAVENLVLLKYLAVRSSVDFIPPSISNLWNLETFIFRVSEDYWSSKVIKVPDSIWNMTKLRHFHIADGALFDLEPHRFDKYSCILDNLQTLSTPYLAYGDDMVKLLRRLKIRKLECIFVDSWDDTNNCNKFPVLESLNQLVSLTVFYKGLGKLKYPCRFNFPSNIKRITLLFFRMPWNEISQLAMLSNLESLKLLSNACEGKRWEMEDNVVFRKLKYLKMANLDIKEWSGTHDHFPNLERLLLAKCERLVKIPLDFAYIHTIRRIDLLECNSSAAKSARLVQEEHMNYWGKDELKIKVNPETHK